MDEELLWRGKWTPGIVLKSGPHAVTAKNLRHRRHQKSDAGDDLGDEFMTDLQ